MSNRSKYVLDTNIIVSALLFRESLPRQVFDQAKSSGIILISQSTLSEIQNVLARPKLRRYITPSERDLFLKLSSFWSWNNHFPYREIW